MRTLKQLHEDFAHRDAEQFGNDIQLSVQANAGAYCTPRAGGLPLEQYSTVEVGFMYKSKLDYPSHAGIAGFDQLFDSDSASPVAGYVSQANVQRLRDAINAKLAE